MTTAEVVDMVVALYMALPWLYSCVQKLDVTNIGMEYDMNDIAKRRLDEMSSEELEMEFDIDL